MDREKLDKTVAKAIKPWFWEFDVKAKNYIAKSIVNELLKIKEIKQLSKEKEDE